MTTRLRSVGYRLGAFVAVAALAFSLPTLAVAEDAHEQVQEHAAEHGDEPGEGHGDAHAEAHELELNLFYGMLGVGEEGEEPNLLYRPPGMPVPVAAMVLNTLILFGAFYLLGRRAVKQGLKDRRERIMRGIEDAAAMRAEAREQLDMYRAKLDRVEAEVERMKQEMREAAEAERSHILAEAKARRERMERDAKLLIEQELKAAHERLLKETVRGAVESAERLLRTQVTAEDQGRLEREYLASLKGRLKGAA